MIESFTILEESIVSSFISSHNIVAFSISDVVIVESTILFHVIVSSFIFHQRS
ncbi:MAG: hypothetical protein P1U46_00780 [Patescibacteria group bacterium]|nr:hypothetical protein [Patescibacteria group bacterium]